MNFAPSAPGTHRSASTPPPRHLPGAGYDYGAAPRSAAGPVSGERGPVPPAPGFGPAPHPAPHGPTPAASASGYGPVPPSPHPGFGPPQAGHGQPRPVPPAPQPRSSRLPSTAEVLGWGGGLTTVVGVAAVTWDFWSAIRGLALVALLLVATAILGVAASVVGDLDRRHDDQLAANLSAGLWWMTGITGTVAIYVATDELASGRAYLALLAAAIAATAMFTAVAHRTGRDSALAAAIASGAVAAFAAASTASLDASLRGLSVFTVALVAVTGLSMLRGRTTGKSYGTSLVVLFAAAQSVLVADGGLAQVAVVAVGMVIAAAVAWPHRSQAEAITTTLLALVVAGQLVHEQFPQAFSLSTGILVAGLGMTAGCIHLVRRSIKDRT